MTTRDQDDWVGTVRDLLERDTGRLDGDISKRLDKMRRLALAGERISEPVNDTEEIFVAAARVALDDSVADLDPTLLRRLEQARATALSKPREEPGRNRIVAINRFRKRLLHAVRPGQLALPAGVLATAFMAIAAVSLYYGIEDRSGAGVTESEVLLFASSDEIELYDNLEFYLWLADNGLPN